MNATRIHGRAERATLNVLPRSVKVRQGARGSAADLVVNGVPLLIEWVGEGWLRDVRPVLERRRDRPDIVVARRMSPGAREALSAAGVGWVDETGAAEIAAGSVIVSRSGRPGTAIEKPKRWTAAVLAVAESLLCGTRATVAATEEATGLSSGSCTYALRVLTDLGLLAADAQRGRDSARQVVDRDQLLDAYASIVAAWRTPLSLQVGVTWRDSVAGLADTGRMWDKARTAWAATGAVAASVIAPFLTTVTSAEVYVDADTIVGLEAAAVDVGLRPIEGGRLKLLPFPTVATRRLVEVVDGLRVAPWPRVYADLRQSGVRGEDAAEHLREVIRAG